MVGRVGVDGWEEVVEVCCWEVVEEEDEEDEEEVVPAAPGTH